MTTKVSLQGRTAVVTGASRGLGRALALGLAEQGADLVLVARDSERLEEVAGEAGRIGVGCTSVLCDLADREALDRACTRIDAAGHVDILINNAGLGAYKAFLEHSAEEHDRILEVNLRALIHLTYRLLPAMLARGSGQILNIASDVATVPIANMAVYAASKHAVRGFTLSLAREVKSSGIKVSLVNPGIIDTGFDNAEQGTKDPSWSLRPAELAELIIDVLRQPGFQMIDELTVHPQMQGY
jgi:short-subunit dehydrogenase